MAIIDQLAAIAMAVLAAVAVLMLLAVIAATALVSGAVRTEERLRTLSGPPPGPRTWLARRLLVVSALRPVPVASVAEPVTQPAWFELATGPKRMEVLAGRGADASGDSPEPAMTASPASVTAGW